MISPDSNEDAAPSKYHVHINEGQGIVIGDNAHVVQQIYDSPAEQQVDLTVAEATYRQGVMNALQHLDFGGFGSSVSLEDVPLENVFVRLTLTREKVIKEPVSAGTTSQAERGERQQREREITVQERIELDQTLSNHTLIVGVPGAGKSTLLRWLAVTFARRNQREPDRVGPSAGADRLPVLVELGRLPPRYLQPDGAETPNWMQLLPQYLTNMPAPLLARAMAEGRCLLLFDGLDEVANRQARMRLTRSLLELARLFPGNRVIIGSRPAGVSESEGVLHPQFQRCEIQGFKPEDVQRFFHFWYALDKNLTLEQQRDAADALYMQVQATPAILHLATTPLLSTILLLIWRKDGKLPKRRVELYERCCNVLIESWEANHNVIFEKVLSRKNRKEHLYLLASLAHAIHSQQQGTTASREKLVPLFAKALQTAGYANKEADATRKATQYLEALGLRSGLLQFMGNDTYGFLHQTFQEYLAARYIAAQPDPEYIDLVMKHLHEAWWWEVHLLTIAHLGSGSDEASKASRLILTILQVYKPPSRILRSSRYWWLRLIGPGKLLPQVQFERRIAWILAREFELAIKGYAECMPDGTIAKVATAISAQAVSLVQHILYDEARRKEQEALLTITCQSLQRQENEAVVSALLEALHDAERDVRGRAAQSLGQLGAGNEAVVSALLEALHDADWGVREPAAESLGRLDIKDTIQLRQVLVALDWCLYDWDNDVRRAALGSIRQLLDGRPIPGYHWVPLQKRRARR